jgi:hypothetical protein
MMRGPTAGEAISQTIFGPRRRRIARPCLSGWRERASAGDRHGRRPAHLDNAAHGRRVNEGFDPAEAQALSVAAGQ